MFSQFTPNRHFLDCHIAGFTYHDGIDCIDELTVGTQVKLLAEPDNPHDPNAVAIYYKDYKIGYIPSDKNDMIAQLLYFGHDIFEAYIQKRHLEEHPERQFRVVIKLKDNSEKS